MTKKEFTLGNICVSRRSFSNDVMFVAMSKLVMPHKHLLPTSQATSVTRWLYYLFNIWPLKRMKFAQKHKKLSKEGLIFGQIQYELAKIAKDLRRFCQSGEISPNLVTLQETNNVIRVRPTYIWQTYLHHPLQFFNVSMFKYMVYLQGKPQLESKIRMSEQG